MAASVTLTLEELRLRKLETRRQVVREALRVMAAAEHPAFLSHFVKCVDSRSGDEFLFQMLSPSEAQSIGVEHRWTESEAEYLDSLHDTNYLEQKGIALEDLRRDWRWQREYLEWVLENDQTVTLKGRQLGVTWVWALIALWYLIFRPGADVLVYSIKEEDAEEVVNRIYDMWLSLPAYFKKGMKVLKPSRGTRPSTRIEIEHANGRVSTITGMPATENAGHSRSAALVIFDEAARQDHAKALWKAVIPATGDKGGKIGVVSTANGMSNFFRDLCVGAGFVVFPKLKFLFLGWWLHPDRDQVWYDTVPLDEDDKAEQYPNDPDEAFLLSGSPYFSSTALRHYAQNIAKPLFKCEWLPTPGKPSEARLHKGDGEIEVFELPEKGVPYAIAADVAEGAGTDFSVGAVINLNTGAPVAEIYMKADYKRFATQLHFTGLWFNSARLAVETQGGYGATVIAYLRDGLDGRKAYPRLYRHRSFERADKPETAKFGFPMNKSTRPKVISELKIWITDTLLPYVTKGFLDEARSFVHQPIGTSPRSEEGSNDDRVMAWGIALELYAEFGEHEHDRKKKVRAAMKTKSKKNKNINPWKY